MSRLLILVLLVLPLQSSAGPHKNGFDLRGSLVPAEEIHLGGPPRDGIPSIDRPRFHSAEEAELKPGDRVLGLVRNGVVKAYPISILNWHEIVNDRFVEEAVVVSFCPLCGSGMAFEARVAGQELEFGVSGLLYNNDLLLYDRESESLWSQIERLAISGMHRGRRLTPISLEHTTWSDWRRRHPETLVLSRDTGHMRSYDISPYAGYEESEETYFPLSIRSYGHHPKSRVLGIELDGQFKAYPFSELAKSGPRVDDEVAGHPISVLFDPVNQNARAVDSVGSPLSSVVLFWFAWYAFHPDTEVYTSDPD